MDSKPTHGPAIAALRDRVAELDGGLLRKVCRRRAVATEIGRLKAAGLPFHLRIRRRRRAV